MLPSPPINRLYLMKVVNSSSPEGDCGGNQLLDGSISHPLQKPKCNQRRARQCGHEPSPEFPLAFSFSSIIHHPSGPDTYALQALSRLLAVARAHVQAFTFIALAPHTTRNTHTQTHTQTQTPEEKRRERRREG